MSIHNTPVHTHHMFMGTLQPETLPSYKNMFCRFIRFSVQKINLAVFLQKECRFEKGYQKHKCTYNHLQHCSHATELIHTCAYRYEHTHTHTHTHTPCLKTPVSSSCLPISTASILELASPREMSQSTNSLATNALL